MDDEPNCQVVPSGLYTVGIIARVYMLHSLSLCGDDRWAIKNQSWSRTMALALAAEFMQVSRSGFVHYSS